ncbi:hypothetical protein PI124_g20935 [Phytophthora idaei]|nr:hypothetical protein PI125_g18577 [Phytophthora idaei]KAG3152194.1 hypothetical protein PI126_g10622 [Phytophthora idaei]KAG3234000.1 hypothetical protein PI124_g20935 [Phytophthora idaei]
MGRVDGLSRLHMATVNALFMVNRLNDTGANGEGVVQVREDPDAVVVNEKDEIVPPPGLIEVREHGTVVEGDDRENIAYLEHETPSVMGQLCAHYFGLHVSARVRESVA